MKRLASCCIYALIAVLAVLVLLRLGMIERGVYAAAGVSPGTSTAPVMDGWYGPGQISGPVGVPHRWASVPGDGSGPDSVASPVDALTDDPVVAASTTGSSSAAAAIVSDDFNACSLDTGLWTFTDPVGDATQTMTGTFTQDAWLSISVPFGTDHNIWDLGNQAPRIMQAAPDGNFEIEVKFESGVGERFQMQGALVEQDIDDFLRFEFHSDGSSTKIFAASFTDGTPFQIKSSIIASRYVAPLYMRVERQGDEGDEWTQSYSLDGTSWTTAVTFTHALTVTKVGTYAANAGSNPPAHTGYVDYFFNVDSPIASEDEARNTLTVHTVGGGRVITEPVKSSYDCGEVVTLTAEAETGWTFAGWTGDLSGTDESVTVTMMGSRVITATFTQDEYTVSVNTVGSGQVIRDPMEPTYHYGDVVTFTARADPGWTFAGWSGDLTGTDITVTKIITGNITVTATFAAEEYTLTINTVGSGSVERDPDQETYHYDDEVTLTARADPGWLFKDWRSGGWTSTNNPETVTITGHITVTATFTDAYRIFVPLVAAQG